MKNDLDIKLSFNNDILLIINQVINETNDSFVYEYNNMINNYIKNPFIEKYIETINKETNDMINFIENNRDYLRLKLNEIFTLNTDTILTDLEQKLNNTVKAINSYNSHFNSFKLSNEIMTFLDSFGTNIIFPKYKDIKEMLDNRTEEVILKNLEINSQDFIKVYNYKIFNKKASEIDNNLTYIFKDMNKSLNNYGLTNEKYKKNLEIEISNYQNYYQGIRRFDDIDNENIKYKQKLADIKLDKTFQELKNSSQNIILFLESFNLFNNFDEKINQYYNEINYQKVISENLIIKNDEYYNLFSSQLNNLTNLSLEYYKNVNLTYNRMKNSIIEHIYEIGKLLDIRANITYEIIPIKYMEIKNNVSSINESRYKGQNSIIIEDYTKISDETKHIIKTTIEKDIVENNFTLDIIVEEEEIERLKVIEKVINKNKILYKYLFSYFTILRKIRKNYKPSI